MAPENLCHNVYIHKSDIWSFGITVWEILTFGARPYQRINAKDVIRLIFGGQRLEQPSTATIDLYATLLQCEFVWNESATCSERMVYEIVHMCINKRVKRKVYKCNQRAFVLCSRKAFPDLAVVNEEKHTSFMSRTPC